MIENNSLHEIWYWWCLNLQIWIEKLWKNILNCERSHFLWISIFKRIKHKYTQKGKKKKKNETKRIHLSGKCYIVVKSMHNKSFLPLLPVLFCTWNFTMNYDFVHFSIFFSLRFLLLNLASSVTPLILREELKYIYLAKVYKCRFGTLHSLNIFTKEIEINKKKKKGFNAMQWKKDSFFSFVFE